MNLIVAVDKNWAIGNNGHLLQTVKADMANFRNITTGKVIVLGRETLKTFPNGKPLKNRTNIILTRDKSYEIEEGIIAHSVEELFLILKKYNPEDIYVVGGASVYEQLLPYVNTAYITNFHKEYIADKYFPNLDNLKDWKLVSKGEMLMENDVPYSFNLYKKE